jgi:hypothetical protein
MSLPEWATRRRYVDEALGATGWRPIIPYDPGASRDLGHVFDAIQIGLTATPAAHTIAYFGDITYRYEYDRAVHEGYQLCRSSPRHHPSPAAHITAEA